MICDIFFFNDTATTEIYTLSLHDALPIWSSCCSPGRSTAHLRRDPAHPGPRRRGRPSSCPPDRRRRSHRRGPALTRRSEEHTSELQSRQYLVCRLLLEKKNTINLPSISLS